MGNSRKTTENQTDSKKTNTSTDKTETSEEKKRENNLRIRKDNNGRKWNKMDSMHKMSWVEN